jgi:hypothetical protein
MLRPLDEFERISRLLRVVVGARRPSAGRSSRRSPRRDRRLRQLPACMTAMRSEISNISSRSWLMTSTAEPAREVDQRLADRAAAPASTPQVGWLTTSTGLAVEFAADDEFLQVAARERGGLGVAALLRTSKASMTRSRGGAIAARRMTDRADKRRRSVVARQHRFSDSFMAGTAPWPSAPPARRRRPSIAAGDAAAAGRLAAITDVGAACSVRRTRPRRTRPGRCRRRRRCRRPRRPGRRARCRFSGTEKGVAGGGSGRALEQRWRRSRLAAARHDDVDLAADHHAASEAAVSCADRSGDDLAVAQDGGAVAERFTSSSGG